MGRLISKLPLIVTAAPWKLQSEIVNRQYRVGDSKYVVNCDPPTLRHVTRRMRIAPKRFTVGRLISNLPLIITATPWKL